MKMTPETFAELSREMNTVAREEFPNYTTPAEGVLSTRQAYTYFNTIMFNRHNPDDHPAFQRGKKRLLPFTGHGVWLNNFYAKEDLNDSHIRTALKRICPNANWSAK